MGLRYWSEFRQRLFVESRPIEASLQESCGGGFIRNVVEILQSNAMVREQTGRFML
ncbi:MAG: hypothetical protein JW739_06205 [Opitutales bacterium]|nr:hypothetical protein [Opitutales bacterium]